MLKNLINDFARDFRFMAEKAAKYIEEDKFNLIVKFEDGGRWTYNSLSKTIRRIPRDSSKLTEHECKIEFSDRLRHIMLAKGITQDELAAKSGIAQPTISRYASGKALPNFYNTDRIAKALRCSIDSFRYYDEDDFKKE